MPKSPLKALIFDMDGTLADTERDAHRVAFNRAFHEAGLDWDWDVQTYGDLLKITGGKERIAHYMTTTGRGPKLADQIKDRAATLHSYKNRHLAALLADSGVPLRPGVERLIREAHDTGVRLAVATTGQPENVAAILSHAIGAGWERWFDVIGAGDVVAAKKPAPDIYLWVLERLGLAPHQCVALEDSENGLRAALLAGIPTVVSVNDYTRNQDFSGAALVVEDLSGVDLERLRELIGRDGHRGG